MLSMSTDPKQQISETQTQNSTLNAAKGSH